MPFYVVRSTWSGAPAGSAPEQVRLVAECSNSASADGLAAVEAAGHTLAGADPDEGGWWASDAGQVHRIEVRRGWTGKLGDPET
jgi:hypothetical protein